MRKDVSDSTNPALLGKHNCTPAALKVNFETSVEPYNSPRVANQVRKGLHLSQPQQHPNYCV